MYLPCRTRREQDIDDDTMVKIPIAATQVNKSPHLIGANARLHQLRQQFAGESEPVGVIPVAAQQQSAKKAQSVVEKRAGWLTALCKKVTQTTKKHSAEIGQTNPSPQTITVPIDILTALLQKELAGIGRIWLLARSLDANGRGWISVERLRETLTHKAAPLHVCGWRRLRQLLQAGKGILWERDDQGRLWLFGLARVATRLHIARFSSRVVSLPVQKIVGSIATVKATFLAAFHAGRKAMPISRAALREATGVPERTQQEYDKRSDTRSNINISLSCCVSAEAQQEHAFQHGGAAFTFTDKKGVHGTVCAKYQARQLPNSYQNKLKTASFGRKRKLNKQLKRQTDLVNKVARGNGREQAAVDHLRRRYFDDGKRAANSAGQGHITLFQTSSGVWHEWR